MLSQKGFARLVLIALTVLGIGIGLYLVQTKTDLFPSAQLSISPPSQTAFHLFIDKKYYVSDSGGSSERAPNGNWFYPGEEIVVNLAVSSDIDSANTFSAIINFPNDLLEVVSIVKENSQVPQKHPKMESVGPVANTTSVISTKKINTASSSGGQFCAQVITKACMWDEVMCVKAPCSPQWICKDFPTPCDIPAGWTVEDRASTPCKNGMCAQGSYCDHQGIADWSGVCLPLPSPSCKPRPACLDSEPRCLLPETSDMCAPNPGKNINDYFIRFWLPDTGFDNDAGRITLSGGVSGGGILTTPPLKPIMATITFRAKKPGEANVYIADDSLILRNSDATNILTNRNKVVIQVQEKPVKPVVIGDLDGDGIVGFTDFSILLSNWGTDSKRADINGNGKVDVFDFSIMLSNWDK